MPVRNVMLISLTMLVSLMCYRKTAHNRYALTLADSMKLIEAEYVGEVDSHELFENAMRGMVSGLDQYSSFISESDFKQFQESLDQEFGGIGIVVEVNPDSGRLTVLSPLVGTPAYRAGLRAGDVILRIGDVDTKGMDLKDSVHLMRGAPGSIVHVVVQHAGDETETAYDIPRAIIPIDSVLGDSHLPDGTWSFVLKSRPRIGYIRLTTFGDHSVEELREALKFNGRNVDAFILDLRSNAGGLLSAAVATCDLFVDSGKIVSTRGRDERELEAYHATSKLGLDKSIPMAVLINKYSASASEIVAACLQDHRRAQIVGERSWGKGTVQNVISLEGGRSALKLTTASYWRPSGKNIHRMKDAPDDGDWGVRPDEGLEVKLTAEQLELMSLRRRDRDVVHVDKDGNLVLGEFPDSADPQLDKAVEVLLPRADEDPEPEGSD